MSCMNPKLGLTKNSKMNELYAYCLTLSIKGWIGELDHQLALEQPRLQLTAPSGMGQMMETILAQVCGQYSKVIFLELSTTKCHLVLPN